MRPRKSNIVVGSSNIYFVVGVEQIINDVAEPPGLAYYDGASPSHYRLCPQLSSSLVARPSLLRALFKEMGLRQSNV